MSYPDPYLPQHENPLRQWTLASSQFRWFEPTEHFEFAGSVMIHIMVHAEVLCAWQLLKTLLGANSPVVDLHVLAT